MVRVMLYVVVTLGVFAGSVAAQDRPPPSQVLEPDPDHLHLRYALLTDPLGPVFERYALRGALALSRAHGVSAATLWDAREGGDRLGLEVAYHLWPQGLGLEGVGLGALFGASVERGGGALLAWCGIEAQLALVWEGLAVVIAGGVERVLQPSTDARFDPRARLSFGYAWL